MDIDSNMFEGVCVVRPHGRIDLDHANEFGEGLAPFLARTSADGAPLVLDLSRVPYISSVGLRVLMLASRQVKAQQGRLAVAALTPMVAEVFHISRFDMILRVFDTVADAVANVKTCG